MTTLSNLRTQLRRRVGREMSDDLCDDLLNGALSDLSLEADWPWLDRKWTFTTVSGQTEYTLPSVVRSIESVVVNVDEWFPYSTADADSQLRWGYTIANDVLTFYPEPPSAQTCTVRAVQMDTPLSGGGDSPLLPSQYTPALVELAAAGAWEQLDPVEGRHVAAQRRYERRLGVMRRVETRDARPVLPRVRPGGIL